jgi:methyl coenzyme M reductase subunit C-like uncharacterized protein (methanogenesis marker protein 7)
MLTESQLSLKKKIAQCQELAFARREERLAREERYLTLPADDRGRIYERARELLGELSLALTELRIERLAFVLASHPHARLEMCSDENTGCRYGEAKKRVGRAVKICYRTYRWQCWAVWS